MKAPYKAFYPACNSSLLLKLQKVFRCLQKIVKTVIFRVDAATPEAAGSSPVTRAIFFKREMDRKYHVFSTC